MWIVLPIVGGETVVGKRVIYRVKAYSVEIVRWWLEGANRMNIYNYEGLESEQDMSFIASRREYVYTHLPTHDTKSTSAR